MKTRKALLLLLTLAWPAGSRAQDARIERIRQAYPAQSVRIEAILADAAVAGTPTGPLLDKALEGAAKHVPGDRVVAALGAYAGRLQESTRLIGSDRGASEVVAGADAVSRGVPPQMVRTMAREHRGDVMVPLVVMGDLVEAGVPVENAYRIVKSAMEKQHSADEMLAIPGAVRGLMRQGRSAADAAGMVGNMIGRGRFNDFMGRRSGAMARPPMGAPVPPGSGPPGHSDRDRERGKGKGKPPGGAP